MHKSKPSLYCPRENTAIIRSNWMTLQECSNPESDINCGIKQTTPVWFSMDWQYFPTLLVHKTSPRIMHRSSIFSLKCQPHSFHGTVVMEGNKHELGLSASYRGSISLHTKWADCMKMTAWWGFHVLLCLNHGERFMEWAWQWLQAHNTWVCKSILDGRIMQIK